MARPRLQDEIKQSRPFDQPEAEAILNVARTQEVLRAPLDALMKRHGLRKEDFKRPAAAERGGSEPPRSAG